MSCHCLRRAIYDRDCGRSRRRRLRPGEDRGEHESRSRDRAVRDSEKSLGNERFLPPVLATETAARGNAGSTPQYRQELFQGPYFYSIYGARVPLDVNSTAKSACTTKSAAGPARVRRTAISRRFPICVRSSEETSMFMRLAVLRQDWSVLVAA